MTKTAKCFNCNKPTDVRVCVDCVQVMREQLLELPEFYALSGGEYWTLGASSGKGVNTERSIGLRVDALDARSPRYVINTLESWERDWRETLSTFSGDERALRSQRSRKAGEWNSADTRDLMGLTLVGVCVWLGKHLTVACVEHPAIDVFADELRSMHKRMKLAARIPSDQVSIIECPADFEDAICRAQLRLTDGEIVCERCSTRWDQSRLLMVAKSAGVKTWQPAGVVSEYLGVPASTLSSWARRGLIERRGTNYLWSSVVEHLNGGRVDSA